MQRRKCCWIFNRKCMLKYYLTPEMEEVAETVWAQIRHTALGDVQVLRRSVQVGFERIKTSALSVLQGHVNPVEQLCGLVHGCTSFYSGHHVGVFRGLLLLEEHRQMNRRVFCVGELFSVIPPDAAAWVWSLCAPRESPRIWRNRTEATGGVNSERGTERKSLNDSRELELVVQITELRHSEGGPTWAVRLNYSKN